MFGSKLKVSAALYDLLKRAAEIRGVSSVDELVEGILEREAQKIIQEAGKGEISQSDIDDISKKLQGLGYLE